MFLIAVISSQYSVVCFRETCLNASLKNSKHQLKEYNFYRAKYQSNKYYYPDEESLFAMMNALDSKNVQIEQHE